jgi:glycosyltransferase involved in cell wall biosynthesis
VSRVLALVGKAPGISPGQRFRIEQWAPHLRARHGLEVDFHVFESPSLTRVLYQPGHRLAKGVGLLRDTWRRREVLRLARRYDVVLVYREAAMLGPALYERLLSWTRAPIVYDFDDAIWLPSPGSVNGALQRLRFPGKTAAICALARRVVVGNEHLAAWARRHNPRVTVVPTSIELARFPVQPPLAAGEPFTVVWTGTFSTLPHLELARPALERLARRRRLRVRVICDRPLARPIEGAETEFVRWRADEEAAQVGRAHVGLMPLPDDEAARGKCGCKALQYMAAGRPAIVSPVGVNAEIVRDGENGLCARGDEEWVRALDALAGAPERAAQMGAAARRTVEERFSAEHAAARFAEAVHEARGAR